MQFKSGLKLNKKISLSLVGICFLAFILSTGCNNSAAPIKEIKKEHSQKPVTDYSVETNTDTILKILRQINACPKVVSDYLDILEKHALAGSEAPIMGIDTDKICPWRLPEYVPVKMSKRIIGEWTLTNPCRKEDHIKENFFIADSSGNGFQSKQDGEFYLPEFLTIKADNINWLIQVVVYSKPNFIGRSIKMYYIDDLNDIIYSRNLRPDADWEIWKKDKTERHTAAL